VEAPSGSAALCFSDGPERGGGPGVFEVLAKKGPRDLNTGEDPNALTPVLTVSGGGWAKLVGDLTVGGSLTLDGDELVFGALPAQTDSASALSAAASAKAAGQPAQTGSPSGSALAAAQTDEDEPPPVPWALRQVTKPAPQLQIVLPPFDAATGEAPASFAIGTWSKDDKRFTPALTVNADGSVDVPGTLRVGGLKDLSGDTIVDGGLDAEAQRMVTAAAMSGIAGGSALAAKLYQPGTGSVQPAVQPPPGRGFAAVVADLLAADDTLRVELAARLAADHPEVAQALRTALPYRRSAQKKSG
jgi:hypothetical protein